jgi:putative peptidoglycan lipid II flippase
LRLTTPGLSPVSLAVAVRVARVTWPTIAASGVAGLLTGIYHANGRFTWPALVPVLSAILNLALVFVLAREWGVFGVAVAGAAGLFAQAIFLLRDVTGRDRLKLSFNWRHPGVAQVASLLWPLVLSGLLIRYTPVVDRYLASGLQEGSIAHLGYAFKLVSFLSVFLSTGIATVAFPRMILSAAARDIDALQKSVSLTLRVMWLGVVPAIAVGIALAHSLIIVFLQRGAFRQSDAETVAALWQIYLLSLGGLCLGNVTRRAFYALKDTRTISVMGVVEAVGYAVYTSQLARHFGASGVAIGYVVYFSLSIAWQVPVLLWKLGRKGGPELFSSFVRTTGAAVIAGGGAFAFAAFWASPWLQLAFGGAAGGLIYAVCLQIWGGPEVEWTTRALKAAASMAGHHQGDVVTFALNAEPPGDAEAAAPVRFRRELRQRDLK